MNNPSKLQALKDMVDDVYNSRKMRFHWNLTNDVEYKHTQSSKVGVLQTTREIGQQKQITYEANTFVAVRHDEEDDSRSFWLGKISRVMSNPDGTTTLRVQWYDVKAGADIYTGKYTESNKTPSRKRFTPWTSYIDSDTVLMTFDGLTNRGTINGETVKSIQVKVNGRR